MKIPGQRTTDNGKRTTDNGQRTTDNGQRTTANITPCPDLYEYVELK